MLSEQGFVINHWITIIWLVAAAVYSFSVVAIDVKKALKGVKKH